MADLGRSQQSVGRVRLGGTSAGVVGEGISPEVTFRPRPEALRPQTRNNWGKRVPGRGAAGAKAQWQGTSLACLGNSRGAMCLELMERRRREIRDLWASLGVEGFKQGSKGGVWVFERVFLGWGWGQKGNAETQEGARRDDLDQGNMGVERSRDTSVGMEPTGVSDR